jgi:hypothetical protein
LIAKITSAASAAIIRMAGRSRVRYAANETAVYRWLIAAAPVVSLSRMSTRELRDAVTIVTGASGSPAGELAARGGDDIAGEARTGPETRRSGFRRRSVAVRLGSHRGGDAGTSNITLTTPGKRGKVKQGSSSGRLCIPISFVSRSGVPRRSSPAAGPLGRPERHLPAAPGRSGIT